jgi:Tol biopolymer transport system component
MPLTVGTRLGPYEVIAPLGAGGMGEVYRARDTKLGRDVALKVLPSSFAGDSERLARFRREAQVLASLNHPNIAHIYGFEDSGETHALVLELVEGPTLADRIAEGPIPLDDALQIARQIAEALETAHEQGIVHRDLKPANVKVRDDGSVKVLDFGLAKALTPDAAASSDPTNSPTLTARATQLGMILGTAAYMAPEQAKGKPVDRRADIWAFGVVLHEMLTGRRLFEAEDVSETLAAVLTREVTVTSLPGAIPHKLRALIRDCLVRDPKQRLRDIGDARIVLDRIAAGAADDSPSVAPSGRTQPPTRGFVWPAVAIVALIAAGGLGAALLFRGQPAPPPPVRFNVPLPPGVGTGPLIIRLSPDGRRLAFAGVQDGKRFIFVHDFETGTAQPIRSTEGFAPPAMAWSPRSDAIAFAVGDKLRRAAIAGGPSEVICDLEPDRPHYAAWGATDVVIVSGVSRASRTSIMRVPATGGRLEPVTALEAAQEELAHTMPEFLPDGRHFFFVALGPGQDRALHIGSLESRERRQVPGITSLAVYSPSGHLLFLRDGALMAQPFDAGTLTLSGAAAIVAEAVAEPDAAGGPFSVSATGTLTFRSGARPDSQLTWVDRAGRTVGTVGPPGEYADIELSIDERYVAFEAGRPGDVSVLDLQTGIPQRVTSDPARDADPVWSPDGRTIAFRGDRSGGRLYTRGFGVIGEDTLLHQSDTRDSPVSWSLDGKYIAYESLNNILALPMTGERAPMAITRNGAGVTARAAQISPDGKWIAYESNEEGRLEVFVQSFPQPGLKRRVSPGGGRAPRWSRDGRELFYVSLDRNLMALTVQSTGGSLNVGAPARLFPAVLAGSSQEPEYDVSKTGRFLMNIPTARGEDRPITVIVNWTPPRQ